MKFQRNQDRQQDQTLIAADQMDSFKVIDIFFLESLKNGVDRQKYLPSIAAYLMDSFNMTNISSNRLKPPLSH